MVDLPKELHEILKDKQLNETVKDLPGSQRFKAMVLGLSALRYVKTQEKGDLEVESENKE